MAKKTPYLVAGTTLRYYINQNIFLKVVSGTKCSSKIFQKFSCSKIKYLDWYKYPKKSFFELFSSISWGLSIGTKGGKSNFYSSNILNLPLIPVMQKPGDAKKLKKVLFGYLYRSKYFIF
jgi:hypothetical protein